MIQYKKELLLKEVSRANSMEVSILKDKLAKLESEKPCPYGTLQAVSTPFLKLLNVLSMSIV